uniref:Uncharacterized protein n=1 Tax=Aegilops tauschii subsp. strangulata TaxID=200361 RepID=A0A453GWN3_AEGTS
MTSSLRKSVGLQNQFYCMLQCWVYMGNEVFVVPRICNVDGALDMHALCTFE